MTIEERLAALEKSVEENDNLIVELFEKIVVLKQESNQDLSFLEDLQLSLFLHIWRNK